MEIYKTIEFRGSFFNVSNYGNIEFQNCKGIRRLFENSNGYLSFTKNNKRFLAHRMVAVAHVPNPENKEYVNHKDGNKRNINADNLEWVSRSENELHSIRVLGNKRNVEGLKANWKNSVNKRPVALFTIDGEFVRNFNSCKELSEYLGVSQSCVNNHLKGRTKKGGNHIFRYLTPKSSANV